MQDGFRRCLIGARCARIHKLITRYYGQISNVLPSLEAMLGGDRVITNLGVRTQYSHDEGHFREGIHGAVVRPSSVEEVSSIVKICNEQRVPVIPFGTGTGLEGGVAPLVEGICIDLMQLDQIRTISDADFYCTVEPGVTRKGLNDALRHTGLWFPIDPGADASLCGMCATSASGTAAVYYGTMKENVIGLEVVLPSGKIIHTRGEGRAPRKSSAGYNLTNLFVGSEGTLGIITSATLRLYGIPEKMAAAVCPFSTIEGAVDAVVQILMSGLNVARLEFLDDVQMDAVNKYSHTDYPVTSTLFIEFYGSTHIDIKPQAETIGSICAENGGGDFQWAQSEEDRRKLWHARHEVYYASLALRHGCKGYITDVCVPVSKLPEVLIGAKQDILTSGLLGPIVGHVGDGNFHCLLIIDDQNPDELKTAHAVAESVARRALAAGGTCTGEHGVGLGKRKFLIDELGSETIALMRTIKAAIDPNNIMNPGKILPEPS